MSEPPVILLTDRTLSLALLPTPNPSLFEIASANLEPSPLKRTKYTPWSARRT